uniref:Ig-like domain-containing protein n=1 Tax=Naja naja TaxID=35670 RepID=A0A8C7E2V6_NAJNA
GGGGTGGRSGVSVASLLLLFLCLPTFGFPLRIPWLYLPLPHFTKPPLKSGQPHFVIVGYMDGQVFVHYDSNKGRLVMGAFFPLNSREEMGVSVPVSRSLQGGRVFACLDKRPLNHPPVSISGLHTIQLMHGCELQGNGSQRGFLQYGYKGRTFINFDKETLTWVAPNPLAQISKRKLDADAGYNQYFKSYLEKECIDWMWKYLSYGNETLQRWRMGWRHICRLDGFYPREIDASWARDGRSGWRRPSMGLCIRIDPKERGRYQCHVEHDGLQKPLDLKYSNVIIIKHQFPSGMIAIQWES